MKTYKVKGSLVFKSYYGDIDFKGCDAQIVDQTESFYFVRFYLGLPFMFSKAEFHEKTMETEERTNIDQMYVADVTLMLDERPVKKFRTVISPSDDDLMQVKANVLRWYSLTFGIHYDEIVTEEIEKINSNNKKAMAKQTINTSKIEEAEVVSETTETQKEGEVVEVSAITIFESAAKNLSIEMPKVFFTDYGEHSLEKVADIEKEVDDLLKIATPETYGSTAIKDQLDALSTKAQKMRTMLDKKRKEVTQPLDKATKALIAAVKPILEAAQVQEDRVNKRIQDEKDHEAEELRKKEEAKRIRTEERRESLRALGGAYDVNNGTIVFEFLPGTIVNTMQMMEYDDAEWANQFNVVKEAYDAEQTKLKEQRDKEAAEKDEAAKKLKEADEKILKYRTKELKFEGFEFDEALQSFKKGAAVIHALGIGGYSEEDWDRLMELANQEPQAPIAPVSPVATNVVTPVAPVAPIQPTQSTFSAPAVQTPVSAPVDVLASVIGGMVTKQEERVEELDGTIRTTLVFTREKPFFEKSFNKSKIRIVPFDYAEHALHGESLEKIVGNVNDDELGLKFLAIRL